MNATSEALARDKELLLMRSALCRLRLHHQARDLRASLPWNRTAFAVATSPPMRRLAFGLALSFVGVGRAARAVMLAGRFVLLAKLANSLIAFARTPARQPTCAIEQTLPGLPGSLDHSPRSST